MKILEHTDTRLVCRLRSAGAWMFFGFWAGPALLVLLSATKVDTLRCTRSSETGSVQAALTHDTLFHLRASSQPIELRRAKVTHEASRKGSGTDYVDLITATGTVRMTEINVLRSNADAWVAQINAFMSDPARESLTVQSDQRGVACLIALVCLFPGLLVRLLIDTSVVITLDRARDLATIQRYRFRATKVRREKLSSVTRARVKSVKRCCVVLVLHGGEELSVDFGPTSGVGHPRKDEQLAECLNEFLGRRTSPQ